MLFHMNTSYRLTRYFMALVLAVMTISALGTSDAQALTKPKPVPFSQVEAYGDVGSLHKCGKVAGFKVSGSYATSCGLARNVTKKTTRVDPDVVMSGPFTVSAYDPFSGYRFKFKCEYSGAGNGTACLGNGNGVAVYMI